MGVGCSEEQAAAWRSLCHTLTPPEMAQNNKQLPCSTMYHNSTVHSPLASPAIGDGMAHGHKRILRCMQPHFTSSQGHKAASIGTICTQMSSPVQNLLSSTSAPHICQDAISSTHHAVVNPEAVFQAENLTFFFQPFPLPSITASATSCFRATTKAKPCHTYFPSCPCPSREESFSWFSCFICALASDLCSL